MQDGLLQGIEQGIERGMERGIERGTLLGEKRRAAREVALRLLALGTLELTQIAEIAGLPLQELEYLQNERLN